MKNLLLKDTTTVMFSLTLISTLLSLTFAFISTSPLALSAYVILWFLILCSKSFIQGNFTPEDYTANLKSNLNSLNINILILSLVASKIFKAIIISEYSYSIKLLLLFSLLVGMLLILLVNILLVERIFKKINQNSKYKINATSFLGSLLAISIIVYYFVSVATYKSYILNIFNIKLNIKTIFFQIIILVFLTNKYLTLISANNISKKKIYSKPKHYSYDLFSNVIVNTGLSSIQIAIMIFLLTYTFNHTITTIILAIVSFLFILRIIDTLQNIETKNEKLALTYLNKRTKQK